MITAERLRELVTYDGETGVFTWRAARGNGIKAGDVAGSLSGNGYKLMAVGGRRYNAHRLAWLHVHGKWPAGQIDHINGDKTDNRIANLRDVDASTNRQNMRAAVTGNGTGMLGVRHMQRNLAKPFQARITAQGKDQIIGYFATPEAAHAAYVNQKRRLHAGCTI